MSDFCLPIRVPWGFPDGSDSKESACNERDLGLIPGSGRSPGKGNGNPLQYSCLENPMNRGAWWTTVHGVAKSRTRLSNWVHMHTHTHTRARPWGAQRKSQVRISHRMKSRSNPYTEITAGWDSPAWVMLFLLALSHLIYPTALQGGDHCPCFRNEGAEVLRDCVPYLNWSS